MATTTKFATSASGTSWTNASNVLANDGVYATYTIAARTTTGNNNTLSNFGFDSAIPAGSTINSVTLEVEHKVSTQASIANLNCAVAVGGTAGTTNTDSTEPLTDTIRTYTNVTRPGGGSWTRADLLNGTFTVLLWASSGNSTTSCTYSWDYATVTVDYTAPVNATTVVTGTSVTASAGTVTAIASTNATATVTGTSATSSFGTVAATGTASKTVTGIETTSSFGTVASTGTASKTVTGIEATSAAQSITATGTTLVNGTATVIGREVTSSVATISATGTTVINGTATVTGVESTSQFGTISETGDALKTLTGVEVPTEIADITAESVTGTHVNVTGEHMDSSLGTVTGSGTSLVSTSGIELTAYVATVSANGDTGSTNAVANVTTVQATASVGNVTANAGEAPKQPGARFRSTTASIIHTRHAKAKVQGVETYIVAGKVFAVGVVNARAKVKFARIKTGNSVIVAKGIQNPTDDQLLMMFLA